uniref:Uncharacterized protein n=1 Tax=Caenorhabditis japonica TaxID=281687 RepID=A0A8R1DVU1_CAEJA
MLGFSSFLIAVKSVSCVVYLVLLVVSEILFDPSFFYTVMVFGIAESVLIAITIYHGFNQTLKVVFVILGSEMVISITKLIFAMILMGVDGGKDCFKDDHCSIIFISNNERFGLFFFILSSAFLDGLTALLTIANSPQMHEFEMGNDFLF